MAYVHQRYAQRSPASPRLASSPRTPHHRYVQRSPSPEIACSPRTPPRIPQPSSADVIEQSPQVLRLVAKPHAKIVPGKLASKDLLACAAAASPTRAWNEPPAPAPWNEPPSRPTSVRDAVDAEQDQSQHDRVRSRSRSITCQQSFPEMDADDSLWELVWQPIENLPPISATQQEDTIDSKQTRGRPTRARSITSAPTTPEGANHPDNSFHQSGTKAPEILPPTPCRRMASPSMSPTPSRRGRGKSPSRSPSPGRRRVRGPSVSPSPSRRSSSDRSPRGSPTPSRRRLRGKQPNPDEFQGTSRSPSPVASRSPSPSPNATSPRADSRRKSSRRQRLRGHYDVLGLPKTAGSSEVRAGYRRMALATHPDNGGDPDDFRRVAAAFEELGDESRRIAYDRNLGLFGSRDGSGSMKPNESVGIAVAAYRRMALATHPDKKGDPHDSRKADKSKRAPYDRNLELFGSRDSTRPEDVARWWYGAARVTLFKLMDLPQSAWAPQIASMQNAELQALLHLLHGSMILLPAQSGNDTQADRGYHGSQRSGSGYKLVMSWAHLSSSSVHTDSVAQAIDWQIAFAWLRSTVQARLEECLGQTEDLSELSEDPKLPKLPTSESSKIVAAECKSLPQVVKEAAAKDKDKQKQKAPREKIAKEKEPATRDKNKQKAMAAKEKGLKRKREKETAPKDKNKQKVKAAKEKEQLKRKREKEKEAKAKVAAKKKADMEKLKAKKVGGSTKKKAVMQKLKSKTAKENNKKDMKAKVASKFKAHATKGSKKTLAAKTTRVGMRMATRVKK